MRKENGKWEWLNLLCIVLLNNYVRRVKNLFCYGFREFRLCLLGLLFWGWGNVESGVKKDGDDEEE